MAEALLRVILPMGLAGSAAFALFWPLRPLLLRAPARLRRRGLAAVALLFLLPLPLLLCLLPGTAAEAEAPAYPSPAIAPLYSAGERLGEALLEPAPSTHPQGQPALNTARPSPWPHVAAGVYGLGAALAALWGGGRYLLFHRRLRKSCRPVDSPGLRAAYGTLCGELGISAPPRLLCSGEAAAPFLTGILSPRIVLPDGLCDVCDDTLFALRHELVHYKHGDVPLKLAVWAVVWLHWCNPLAYLLRRECTEVCEQACDEAVITGLDGAGRHAYALALLNCAAASLPYPAAGFASPTSRMKARLQNLLQPRAHRRGVRLACGAALCAALLCATLAGCSLAAGALSAAEPPAGAESGVAVSLPGEESVSLPEGSEPAAASLPKGSTPDPTENPAENGGAPEDGGAPESDVATGAPGSDALAEEAWMLFPVPAYSYVGRGFADDHKGLDIAAPAGSQVIAAADGTVTTAEWHWSYGWYVVIDHGGGVETLYSHFMEESGVSAGQSLAAGAVIGSIGATGEATGTLNHFEVRVSGAQVDPLDYIVLPQEEA